MTAADVSRVIEMAWENGTPFVAIELQFSLNESAVIRLMRQEIKASAYKMWRCAAPICSAIARRTHAIELKSEVAELHCTLCPDKL